MKKALSILFGVIMIIGGCLHLAAPGIYSAMIPPIIPELPANILAAVSELGAGIFLLIPRTRKYGALGFFILMILFTPLHIWDLFRPDPVMGSFLGAVIRLVIQFLLIAASWWIYSTEEDKLNLLPN